MASNSKNLAELLNSDVTLTATDIANGAVTTDKLAADAVTTAKIASSVNLGRRNLVINGAMNVAQRGVGPVTASDGSNEGYSTVDRFYLNFNAVAGGAIDISQSTDAPSGFANSVKLQCSTTNTSFATTQAINLEYRPEAQDLQQLSYGTSDAKQMTVSWYMKSVNFTSPISLTFETRDGTSEYYTKSYTPTTSWTRYTCTIPGSTSATINNDTGQGMFLKFVIAGFSGGSYAVSSDSTAWSTTRADYVDDIGNFTSSTSNELYITGVQMEIGDTATPFEHRSYGEELALCQRYYQRWEDSGTTRLLADGYCVNSNIAQFNFLFHKVMRTAPTMSSSGNTSAFNFGSHGENSYESSIPLFELTHNDRTRLRDNTFASITAGNGAYVYMIGNNGGVIEADAEL